METKQIIAILVIAAVAAVAVGGAYAYTATLQNESNSAPTQYLAISVPEESRTATMYSETFNLDELYFDTLTKWNVDKQNITYTPKGESPMPVFGFDASSATLANAGIINALQVGETLVMTVDSGLIRNYTDATHTGAQDWEYYEFSVKTEVYTDATDDSQDNPTWNPKALNSDEETQGSIYWLVYSVNGVYSFIDMDEAEKIVFTSDIASEDTLVTVAIFAQETVSENPIPNAYMSYKDVRFTFTAEVPDNASVKTDIVGSNDKTITLTTTGSSVAADMVLIVDAEGSGYFMKPTTEYASASEVYTIGANTGQDDAYTVKAVYDGQMWYSANPEADISSQAATVTYNQCEASALAIVNPPNCGYENVAAGAPLDLTGIVLKGTFTYGTDETIYVYFSAESIGIHGTDTPLILEQGDGATAPIFDDDGKLVNLEANKTYDKLKISFGTISTEEFSIATASS